MLIASADPAICSTTSISGVGRSAIWVRGNLTLAWAFDGPLVPNAADARDIGAYERQ